MSEETVDESTMQWFYCGHCSLTDLTCLNRERQEKVRCCQRCDGHSIPITDTGRAFLAAIGKPDGDGIDVLQAWITLDRAERIREQDS